MNDESMSSEDQLVQRLVADLYANEEVVVGPGDDCAVLTGSDPLRYDLLKTDCIIEGVHFEAGEDPQRVGWKALARGLSDVAAMGGQARAALVTLALPRDSWTLAEVEGWYAGLGKAAHRYGCPIVGGETTLLPSGPAMLSVSVQGSVERERCLLRSRAQLGDAILVTGELGASLTSGWHLDFQPRLAEAAWLAARPVAEGRPTAMMDLSDGLAMDLPRLAQASGLGYRLEMAELPLREGATLEGAIGDGEDYELLFTCAEEAVENLLADWCQAFSGLPLTLIGRMTETCETPLKGGWDALRGA